MHVVVLGSGALGTLFGARIWLGGLARVTLVGRGAHLEAMREHGIHLVECDGTRRRVAGAHLEFAADAGEVSGDVDYLVFTVKGSGFDAAVETGRRMPPPRTVLTLQNGVRFDALLREAFGPGRVVGAVTMEGAEMPEPGVVRHMLKAATYVGEFDAPTSRRVETLASVLEAGSITTRVTPDVSAAKWTKFVQSCAASGVCGITRAGYAPATATRSGAELYVRLVREGVAVMRAVGHEPGPYLGGSASVADLADGPLQEAIEAVRERARRSIAAGYTGGTSLLRDLEAGAVTEAEYLMGDMARTARSVGVDAPLTTAVYLAVSAADQSR